METKNFDVENGLPLPAQVSDVRIVYHSTIAAKETSVPSSLAPILLVSFSMLGHKVWAPFVCSSQIETIL